MKGIGRKFRRKLIRFPFTKTKRNLIHFVGMKRERERESTERKNLAFIGSPYGSLRR